MQPQANPAIISAALCKFCGDQWIGLPLVSTPVEFRSWHCLTLWKCKESQIMFGHVQIYIIKYPVWSLSCLFSQAAGEGLDLTNRGPSGFPAMKRRKSKTHKALELTLSLNLSANWNSEPPIVCSWHFGSFQHVLQIARQSEHRRGPSLERYLGTLCATSAKLIPKCFDISPVN